VAVIKSGYEHKVDPAKTKWPGFACIPLPGTWSMTVPGIARVPGPASPPNPEDATSYLDLWCGFATGRTVPDPIRRLSQAIGSGFDATDTREAIMGYSLVRRITRATAGILDRDAINAFLVTLAAFDRSFQLSGSRVGIWANILERDPDRPLDNWANVHTFTNPETYPRDDFGLRFIPPTDASQPWEIRTLWQRDAFMQVLLALRPSLQSLRQLVAYADVFIRTRPASQPLPGITLPDEQADAMYTMPFIRGAPTTEAFLVDATSTPADPPGKMDVDDAPSAPNA
jgi:hypothetical protein